jgi:hypothetical protein
MEHLGPTPRQHGFRPRHSTTSALLKLTTAIADGFNSKKPPGRTIAVALDLSKAFDCVDHLTLLHKMSNTSLPPAVLRWLNAYLSGRQASTLFRDSASTFRIVRTGVPQGSVIAPALFNFYISDFPAPPASVDYVGYADDVTIFTTGPDIDAMTKALNDYLPRVARFFSDLQLDISASKSSVTLFTPDPKQAKLHPQVKVNGELLPLIREPKILGVTLDTMFTFAPHCKNVAARVQQRNNVLRALAGSQWGQQKETLLLTYKATGRSVINYAAPVWSYQASLSSVNRIQVAQNAALRAVTGCVKMTSSDHLHQETKILPVKQHNDMLSAQFLASCHSTGHPNRDLVDKPLRPRPMKHTLHSAHNATVTTAFTKIGSDDPKKVRKEIHTSSVHYAMLNQSPNLVLGGYPPPISTTEVSLPRVTRCRLAQLRAGYSPLIRDYACRIDPNIPNSCPLCDSSPHDVRHLFSCSQHPITSSVEQLWSDPTLVAHELDLLPPLQRSIPVYGQ